MCWQTQKKKSLNTFYFPRQNTHFQSEKSFFLLTAGIWPVTMAAFYRPLHARLHRPLQLKGCWPLGTCCGRCSSSKCWTLQKYVVGRRTSSSVAAARTPPTIWAVTFQVTAGTARKTVTTSIKCGFSKLRPLPHDLPQKGYKRDIWEGSLAANLVKKPRNSPFFIQKTYFSSLIKVRARQQQLWDWVAVSKNQSLFLSHQRGREEMLSLF